MSCRQVLLAAFFFQLGLAIAEPTIAAGLSGESPVESLKSIQVAPGFKVELAATEPLVKDPIAFEWGADGKLWVVEMGDYPLGIDGKGKPGGVVRFLEDTDGDGRYDRQTTFLDGLGFPTGVMPWRKGVLVACAPDIFYAEDRDGDGKADHREVLFTGFGQGNQQHRLNGFELGLDGWVYGANGDSGGNVRSVKTGTRTSISGRDFRFRPDTGEFEAESGQTQYGRHRDDWGHWFGNNNPNWGWHYVLANHDLRRNPHYAPPDPRQTLEPDTRLYPDQPHARPVQRPGRGQPRHVGQQPDTLSRRPLRSRVRHQPVRQRAGAQPGASDGARARRRELSRPSRAERGGPRVSRLQRQLVPAHHAQDRARRSTLDRRYVSRGHRASRVDSRRLGTAARPPRGQRARADLSRLPGRSRSPGRSRGSTSSTPPGSWPRSTAPAAGSATRPSGCSCIAAIPPRSRLCERSCDSDQASPRRASRRSGRWPISDGLDEHSASGRPRRTPIRACARA